MDEKVNNCPKNCSCICDLIDCSKGIEPQEKKPADDTSEGYYLTCIEVDDKTVEHYENEIKRLKKCIQKAEKFVNAPAKKKCVKKKYYQFGLLAKLTTSTTDIDMNCLIKFGFRTFVIQTIFYSPDQLEQIVLKMNTALANFEMDNKYDTPIGLAVEIQGDIPRLGRIRNNAVESLEIGKVLTLTINEEYRYISQKDILYVFNLWRYMKLLKINDYIKISNTTNKTCIELRVMKVLSPNVTVCVESGGEIESFMIIKIPYEVNYELSEFDCDDIQFAIQNNAHFLIIPNIKSFEIVAKMKEFCINRFSRKFEIIGKINLLELYNKRCLICDILKEVYAIWVDDYLVRAESGRFFFNSLSLNLNKMAHQMDKPLIATIPIKTRADFHKLESSIILHELDSFLIEKSELTSTYPIIVKSLMPLPKHSDDLDLQFSKTTPDDLYNCLCYTINATKCNGIVLAFNSETADSLSNLNRYEIYCPVIAVVYERHLALNLNIRRNMKTVIYQPSIADNSENESIKYGLKFGRDTKILTIGDFVLTFWETIVHNIKTKKLRALYMPENKIYIKQNLVNAHNLEDF